MSELPSSGLVGAETGRELLCEVATLQRLARRPTGLWPPLVVFGALIAAMIFAVGMALAWSPAPTWTVQLGVGLVMLAGGAALRFRWEAV